MGNKSPLNIVFAAVCVVLGLILLNWGVVIFGLTVLATGVYLSYRALPKKAGE